jgi:hypothetical protein
MPSKSNGAQQLKWLKKQSLRTFLPAAVKSFPFKISTHSISKDVRDESNRVHAQPPEETN